MNNLDKSAEISAQQNFASTVEQPRDNQTVNQSKAIIDMILATREVQKEETTQHVLDQLPVMNASRFLGNKDGEAMCSKAKFLNFVENSTGDELRNFASFLEMMCTRTKVNIPNFPRRDKSGKEYYWIKVIMPNGIKEFKLILFEGLEYLIHGYLYNLYRFDITFDDMYHEAKKA